MNQNYTKICWSTEKMLRELFCWHEYKPMTYYQAWWDKDKFPDRWEWHVTYRCIKCKKHKEEMVRRTSKIEKYLSKEIPEVEDA